MGCLRAAAPASGIVARWGGWTIATVSGIARDLSLNGCSGCGYFLNYFISAAFSRNTSQTAAPGKPQEGFVTQQTNDRLASRLIGLNIKNPADETIGEIYDVVLTDTNSIKAYIVSVGGFLGIGTRYVAIDPKSVSLNRQDERNWIATMNVNKNQLRAAPEYKWQSEWRKR